MGSIINNDGRSKYEIKSIGQAKEAIISKNKLQIFKNIDLRTRKHLIKTMFGVQLYMNSHQLLLHFYFIFLTLPI